MLEAKRPASTGATTESLSSTTGSRNSTGSAPGSTADEPRSSRRKRGLFRRTGIVLPAFGLAVLLVGIATAAAYVTHSNRNNVNGLAEAINGIPQSGSAAALAQERQTLIVMSAAAKTLTVASKPTMVNPSQVIASAQAQAQQAQQAQAQQAQQAQAASAPPDPGTAQQIGYDMLPSYGFNQTTEWTCLLNLWNRESGWVYDATNPTSGAYGIPQSLPGDKMAQFGADWQTNPTTQIKWGLWYIQQTYGTPCGAWNNELAYGSY
jgi:hypothetical protein